MNWRQTRTLVGVRHIIKTALEEGVDVDECFAGSAITREDLDKDNVLIQAWQEMVVIRNLVRLCGRPGLGFSTGFSYHITSIGVLGLAMLASKKLTDAFNLNRRFTGLTLTFCPLSYIKDERGVWLCFDDSVLAPDARQYVIERGLSAYIQVCSELLQRPLIPLEIEVKYDKPCDLASYHKDFTYPVRFGSDRNSILLAKEDYEAELPQANKDVCFTSEVLCEKMCAELSLPLANTPMARKVQLLLIRDELFHLTCAEVSQKLGCTERSLHRYLSNEGHSFKGISDGARKMIAEQLLQSPMHDLESISEYLGYSNATSFSRAFKRWSGFSPGSWLKFRSDSDVVKIIETHVRNG